MGDMLDQPPMKAKADECRARGGAPSLGVAARLVCRIQATDSGKRCTDGDQCQAGICMGGEGEEGTPATGYCRADNIVIGCPLYTVSSGKLSVSCVD